MKQIFHQVVPHVLYIFGICQRTFFGRRGNLTQQYQIIELFPQTVLISPPLEWLFQEHQVYLKLFQNLEC